MITVEDAVKGLKADYPGMCVHGLSAMSGAPEDEDSLLTEAYRWPTEIQLARKWLSKCRRIKTFRWQEDTYSYKGEIEAWAGITWIPHIAVLVAARQLGIPMKINRARPHAGLLQIGAKRP